MQGWRLQLLSVLSGVWQYRWWGLATAWVVCVVGWLGVAAIPNTYQSEAKVYIDTDSLLRPLLNGLTVETDTAQQISVMLHTLLTDPNVERVVRVTNPNAAHMSRGEMHDAIGAIVKNVQLRDLGTKNLYAISYSDSDPATAQAVDQALLSVLVDSNIGLDRRDTDDASGFLDNQIAEYERKLQEADQRRADFKTSHLAFFASSNDIVTAKTAVVQAQSELDDAVSRRNSLQGQIATTPALIDIDSPAPVVIGGTGAPPNKRAQLAEARAKLDELRAHYTDSYPDVVAEKQLIAKLESDIAKPSAAAIGDSQVSNPAYIMLRTKLADEEIAVAVAREHLSTAQKHLDDAEKTAATAIGVQRQYEGLDRDYTVLHDNYEKLLQRREAASMTRAVGDQQSSITFRVVDPPLKPSRPVAPNRILLNLLILLTGIGAGGGAAFLFSRSSGKFISVGQLTEAIALPVIGVITVARTAADIARARRAASFFAMSAGMLVVGYLVVLFFFHTYVDSIRGSLV
ncbi:MAG: hypothetical protein KGJ78_02225 [Alphaproteobacteria bacterium]|nr:hypothetical protein [Alphaproteobacteria bacterium]